METYKKLTAWKKAMDLVIEIYRLTSQLPESEAYGLASQMTRAAISIPSNIAEGYRRGTKNEFHRFLTIAYGSGAELETQLEILRNVYPKRAPGITRAEGLLNEAMKLLHVMIRNPKSSFTH